MRWTQTLIPTLRQPPAEAVAPSHQLMLRAGLIQQVAAGTYAYLPLGWRSLHKVMSIIRQEMDRAGAIEVFLPALQPIEWWEQTGRRADYGENLFVVKDRHGREQALGPTHEEVITKMIGAYVSSYRQLPINLYQIQTKFRDEFRPRFGVLRSREFQMKDAYSFDLTVEALDQSYQAMYDAYCRIFDRCGLQYEVVEAESGPIGGSASHEFMVPSPTGEDTILKSDQGNYAANIEKCEIGGRTISQAFAPLTKAQGLPALGSQAQECLGFQPAAEPTGELEKVHTPGMASIEDICGFMKVKPRHMLKTLVCRFNWQGAVPPERVPFLQQFGYAGQMYVDLDALIAVLRGNHELNIGKLAQAVERSLGHNGKYKVSSVELLEDDLCQRMGFSVGFVGPQIAAKIRGICLVVDPDAAQDQFWASGANDVDHHVKHFNWERDVLDPLGDAAGDYVIVADIRNAQDGDSSPHNDGGVLHESKGIEVGHVFKLGIKYTKAMKVTVLDENNKEVPPIMGCYGIGVNRILAAALESDAGHDDNGIIWPVQIAPYHVLITPVRYEGQMQQVADELHDKLTAAGLDVLLDDRIERPGVKFKDADLIGIPLRLTVGEKGLKTGEIEFKPRAADQAEMVKLENAVDRALQFARR